LPCITRCLKLAGGTLWARLEALPDSQVFKLGLVLGGLSPPSTISQLTSRFSASYFMAKFKKGKFPIDI